MPGAIATTWNVVLPTTSHGKVLEYRVDADVGTLPSVDQNSTASGVADSNARSTAAEYIRAVSLFAIGVAACRSTTALATGLVVAPALSATNFTVVSLLDVSIAIGPTYGVERALGTVPSRE
jgi:LDH2 family malate/lactate/ureidoglycolate dehydrogenase